MVAKQSGPWVGIQLDYRLSAAKLPGGHGHGTFCQLSHKRGTIGVVEASAIPTTPPTISALERDLTALNSRRPCFRGLGHKKVRRKDDRERILLLPFYEI